MEYILIESFGIFFCFFILNFKWPALIDLILKMFKCSFCFAWWSILVLYFLGIAEFTDIFVVPCVVLLIEMLFKKLM